MKEISPRRNNMSATPAPEGTCLHGKTPCHGNRESLPGEMAFSTKCGLHFKKKQELWKVIPFVSLAVATIQEKNCSFRENIS
jgi:hypothetical protein